MSSPVDAPSSEAVRRTYQAARLPGIAHTPATTGTPVIAGEPARPWSRQHRSSEKNDQIQGRCASESRTSEAVSLMLGVNRPSAFFGSLKAIRRWTGPCGDKLSALPFGHASSCSSEPCNLQAFDKTSSIRMPHRTTERRPRLSMSAPAEMELRIGRPSRC